MNLADILYLIVKTEYAAFPGSNLVVCQLTLKNGYHVSGESSSEANADVAKSIARSNAIDKIWALEAYAAANKAVGI